MAANKSVWFEASWCHRRAVIEALNHNGGCESSTSDAVVTTASVL